MVALVLTKLGTKIIDIAPRIICVAKMKLSRPGRIGVELIIGYLDEMPSLAGSVLGG